ncbi:hypothetical protein J3R30DRAFT_3406873 [Lentinula aciculospora]|uniref:Uncharacterized protein n=1 Tax=Lentinula aciculospora TaxID=153920 RepID=A0A9W9A491_9AGAR|nr:hypothetical protein J3R30DRAFT_3406873 [Lentinula aciculospora]
MARTTTAKGRATCSSRSKRVSSTRAHREFGHSFTARGTGRNALEEIDDDELYDDSDEGLDPSDDFDINIKVPEQMDEKTQRRKKILINHPWVSDKNLEPRTVECLGCDKTIRLDKRRQFYLTPWNKHVFRCATIKADHFAKGEDMPFESLVAEVGREAAEICRRSRERDRAKGIAVELTSDPTWIKPDRIPKVKKVRASSPSLSVGTPPSSSSVSGASSVAGTSSPNAPASRRRAPPKTKRARTSSSKSSSSSNDSSFRLSSLSPTPSSAGDAIDVPYHETLAYQIQLALPRIAASQGFFYCCGALQQKGGDHELSHQLGYF